MLNARAQQAIQERGELREQVADLQRRIENAPNAVQAAQADGKCPYCPREGLKSIAIHIGHMHKCRVCRQLTWNCICMQDLKHFCKPFMVKPILLFFSKLEFWFLFQ
jgi:hypothetical protein